MARVRQTGLTLACVWWCWQVAGSAHADPMILLHSYADEVPEGTLQYVERLALSLDEHPPIYGEQLKQLVRDRMSRDPGSMTSGASILRNLEEGRRAFIEGEYKEAIQLLSDVYDDMLEQTALMATNQTLRQAMHRAMLFLAHAYLRTDQNAKSVELVSEVIRNFPDRELSLVHYGPEVVELYKRVRSDLNRQKRGTLTVVTDSPGALVFVNERYVGLSPARVADLLPGHYRVYVQRAEAQGRVHVVEVTGADHKINIDFRLDSALRTEPYVGFLYPTRTMMEKREIDDAAQVGRSLGASDVVLIGLRSHNGRGTLQGTVIAVANGRIVRSGMLALEPAGATSAEITALARFLVLGEPSSGIIVRSTGQTPAVVASSNEQPHQQTLESDASNGLSWRSLRLWKWITLGAGIVGLGAGIPLIVIDDLGSCGGDNCQRDYDTLPGGIAATVIGGVSLAASATLFLLDNPSESKDGGQTTTAWLPWAGRNSLGLSHISRF